LHDQPRTEEEQIHATKRLLTRQNERKRKLMEAGVKYDFEAVSYVSLSSLSLRDLHAQAICRKNTEIQNRDNGGESDVSCGWPDVIAKS